MTSFRGESLARDPEAFHYGTEVNLKIAILSSKFHWLHGAEGLIEVGTQIAGLFGPEG